MDIVSVTVSAKFNILQTLSSPYDKSISDFTVSIFVDGVVDKELILGSKLFVVDHVE